MSDTANAGASVHENGGKLTEGKASGYSWYVLSVLVIIYMLNFIDRQIISILANDIKADLGLTDADLGFLYGTAFAVFYALFGIPFGKLADSWNRTWLMTLGLSLWSAMTALSGLAQNGVMLCMSRKEQRHGFKIRKFFTPRAGMTPATVLGGLSWRHNFKIANVKPIVVG